LQIIKLGLYCVPNSQKTEEILYAVEFPRKLKKRRKWKVMELFVGNLPYSMDDAKLRELFVQFGNVEKAKIITERETGRSKGFGFVTMPDEEAKKATAELNGKDFDGRSMKVSEAHPREDRPPRRERRFDRDRR
jgi:RNA recognition motif-containing protein